MERAIVYTAIAYLACWLVDLAIMCTSRPLMLDPMLKLIIVLICLIAIVIGLRRQMWLWP